MDNNNFSNKFVNDIKYYYNKYFNRLANEVSNRGWDEIKDFYGSLINQKDNVINRAKCDLLDLEGELKYGDPREKYRIQGDINEKNKLISRAEVEIQEALEFRYYFENGFYSDYYSNK